MARINGTNLAAPVVPFTTEDSYATHEAKYGKGGWREVESIVERDSIPAQRREAGMAVYVVATSKVYILANDLTTWNELELGAIDDVKVDGVSVVTNKIANIDLTGKVDKTDSADKVYGTDSHGVQTTYDVDSFGKVDDVRVNGESVVENKIANVSVPTKVSQLQNDNNYQDSLEVAAAINQHNVAPTAHQDIRDSIVAATEFTADTIVPTTTNFVPGTTYSVEQAFQRTANLFGGVQGEIDTVNGLIPNQATTQNQLADKAFVNATVATNAANFRGNWATWADVPSTANGYPEDYTGSRTPTNNDYMVVDDASGYIGTYDDSFTFKKTATGNNNITITYNGANTVVTPSVGLVFGIDNTLKITRADNYVTVAANKQIRVNGTVYEANNAIVSFNVWTPDATIYTTEFSSGEGAYTGSWRFIYVGDWATNGKNGWQPAYRIGTAFTQAQQAAIDSGITAEIVDDYVNPNSVASTAYNTRITALETDKLDKVYTADKIYGTDSIGAQQAYVAGDNLELSNGKINVIGVQQQMFEMPEPTVELLGSIVQYLGDTDEDYTHGVMYQCSPVYGSFVVTATGINNVTLDEEAFMNSNLYDASITSYTFECTRAGLRQTWLLPNGRSHSGTLYIYGISYSGRPTLGATITLTRSVVGYAWEPYAGVLAGNDKIKIVGEKISGVNVVGQYNATTMPIASAELAGTIVQYNGEQTLLSMYRDGHFYRCEEDRYMRNYTLEADPMKYSTLVVDDWTALQDFMMMYENPVTFVWQGDGRGWIEEESMSILGTEDLTSYGITYTLESGQTLESGDKITINFSSSYNWRTITVQDGVEVVQLWPEPSLEYTGKVLLYNGDLDATLPEPDAFSVPGKLYTCVQTYNETTGDWEYEWQALPYQFGLLQYTELPSDPEKVYTDQCIQYVGLSQVWDKYAEDVYLENGHIYRATIVDEDDPDFAAVRYMDVHPYQMFVMPDPIAAYEGVITQYVGENGEYTNGHFYKCVPTGGMTGPSDKVKKDGTEWSVSVDPSILETKTTDPTQTQVFEFRSQGEGYQWVLRVNDTTWTTVEIADYGITVTGTVPYGSELKVKYVEPQPEYMWDEIKTGNYLEQYSEPLDEDLYWTGKMIQYIGSDDGSWKEGHFYKFLTTVEPATSGDVSITITDEETLREVLNNIASDVAMYKLDFVAEGNFWVLRGFDISGNEIGNQAFTPDPTTFEQESGLLVEGTPQPNTPVEMTVVGYWQEITVQPTGGLVDDVQVYGQSVVDAGKVANLNVVEQMSSFPAASVAIAGRIVQYTGGLDTTLGLTPGYFYEAVTTLQTATTTTYGIRIDDQPLFADFLKHDIESEGKDVSYFTVHRQSEDNTIRVRCYSTEGAFSAIHTYTDNTFSTTGLTADETIGSAIATFRVRYDWLQINTQPEVDFTAITGFDSMVKQMLVHDAHRSDLKWETIA